MRTSKRISTWAVVVTLGAGGLITLGCNSKSTKFPTQPPARNLVVKETSVVSAAFDFETEAGQKKVIFDSRASTGNITRYQWNFGDGTGSSQANPVHTFPRFKTYVVTLTVSNAISVDRVSQFVVLEEASETPTEPVVVPEGGGDG